MALDTSVLKFQPPTGPTALEQAGQFANLQALAGQKQLQQLQIKSGGLELQDKQRQLDQNQAINDAFKNSLVPGANGGPPSFDPDRIQNALALGGHGSAIPTVMKGINDNAKAATDLAAARTKVATDQADYGGSVGATVKAAGYDPNVLIAQANHALAVKALDPGTITPIIQQLQQAQQADAQNGTQTARQLTQQLSDQLIASSSAQQKLTNEGLSAQGTAQRGTAALGELALNSTKNDQAAALKTRQGLLAAYVNAPPAGKAAALAALSPEDQKEVAGMSDRSVLRLTMTPPEIAADVRGEQTAAEQRVRDAQTASNEQVNQSIARAHLGVAQQEFALKKSQGVAASDPYGSLVPSLRPIADKLASGDMSLAQISRFPGPTKEALTAAAMQQNHNWTAATFDTKQSFLNADKPESQKLQTVGRIVAHLKDFETDSTALGNSPALALGINLTGKQNKFREDAHAVAAETEKLFAGGIGTEGQTRAWINNLSSPLASARQEAVDGLSQLIGGQFGAMNQAYKAATQEDLPLERFVTPNTQKWMLNKKIDVRGDGGTSTAPGAAPAAAAPHGIPDLGATFNGGKVTKVTRIP